MRDSAPGILAPEEMIEALRQTPQGLNQLVGVTGFEPATSCSQSRRATKLRHTPMVLDVECRPIRAIPLADDHESRRSARPATLFRGAVRGSADVAQW